MQTIDVRDINTIPNVPAELMDSLDRAVTVTPTGYMYRVSSMRNSSAWYGPCEVCHKPASEVFLQSEMRAIKTERGAGWTYHNCNADLFGHEECLRGRRR